MAVACVDCSKRATRITLIGECLSGIIIQFEHSRSVLLLRHRHGTQTQTDGTYKNMGYERGQDEKGRCGGRPLLRIVEYDGRLRSYSGTGIPFPSV